MPSTAKSENHDDLASARASGERMLSQDFAILGLSVEESSALREALAATGVIVHLDAKGVVHAPAAPNFSLTLEELLRRVLSWATRSGLRSLAVAYGRRAHVFAAPSDETLEAWGRLSVSAPQGPAIS